MPSKPEPEVLEESVPAKRESVEKAEEARPFPADESIGDSEDSLNDGDAAPSEEEMAAYLGASSEESDPAGSEKRESDETLPSLEEASALIPAKTKALMEELFRARPDRVKRIDPNEIR